MRLFTKLFLLLILLVSCTSEKHDVLVIAKVSSDVLTAKTFANLLIKKIHKFSASDLKSDEGLLLIKTKIVDDFILNSISQHWAKEQKIVVTTKEVGVETDKIRKSYPDEVYFRKSLIDEKITYKSWVKNIRKSLLIKKISNTLFTKNKKPENKKLKEYFDKNKRKFKKPSQVKLQQIVVEKQIVAEQLLKKLYRKHSFSNLAKVHSVTPEAANNGNLGWIRRGVNRVFDRGFSMGVGRTSSVIKSPYGFHILKVLAKKPSRMLNFTQAKPKITKILLENSREKIYKLWLNTQIKRFSVYKNTKLISSISVSMRGNR